MQIDPNSITWDPAPARPAQAPGIIRGPAPRLDPNQERTNTRADASEARTAAGQTFRTMTPDEIKQQGLPDGGTYQINGLGEIKTVVAPPKPVAPQNEASNQERLARVETALDNLNKLEGMVSSSNMGTGSIVGQESFRAGDDFLGASAYFNQTANNVAGSIEMVQGDLINQIRAEMQESGAPIGVKGADTENEASRLAASIANLAQTQDEDQFLIGLQRARDYYERRKKVISETLGEDAPQGDVMRAQQEDILSGLANLNPQGDSPGFGDDGDGRPLVIVTDRGVEVLTRGVLADGQAGYAIPGETFEGFDGEPVKLEDSTFVGEALDLYQRFKRDEETLGKSGFFDVAKSGISLGLIDEASGIGDVIGSALTGDFNIADNYERGKTLEQMRTSKGREALGAAAIPVELLGAGGAVRLGSAFGQARNAVNALQGSGRQVTRAGVQGQLVKRSAIEGAGLGALAGAAQGDGLQERATNASIGLATGGALGYGGQRLGNALANRAPRELGSGQSQQVIQAADNLDIEVTPAVTGGRLTQAATATAKQSLVADLPIDKGVTRMQGQAQAAREAASGRVGQAVDAEDAGNIVRSAAKVFSEKTANTGTNLYTRAFRLAGDVKFEMKSGVQKADEWLEELSQGAKGVDGTIYKEVAKLREALASRPMGIKGIPRTRDEFRAQMQVTGLRGGTTEKAFGEIIDAVEQDILNGLRSTGNERAANAFDTATKYWRKRVETIDSVLEPILGKSSPKSGEQILTAIERMADAKTGNASRLQGLFRAMPKREAATVRATIIERLGRPNAGSADDATGFNFNTFGTTWNKMSPRARAILFPKEHREALDDIFTVAQAVKRAGSLENSSNTARAVTGLGQASWFAVEPLSASGALAVQYAAGKLLASPKFARMLARAPRNPTQAQRRAFTNRLGNLAQSEPTLAREINAYQRALAANDNSAGRLAAEEQPEE